MTQVFFNETELNGRFQVMANVVIKGRGVKNLGGCYNVNYNGQTLKGFTNYWVSKSALDQIKDQFNAMRACF